MFLEELEIPVTRIRGVGPQTKGDLARLGITCAADLLRHLPRAYDDRSRMVPLYRARAGETVNTVATVVGHEYIGRPPKRILTIQIRDETDSGELLCFGRNFLASAAPAGAVIRVCGVFTPRNGRLQSSSFDFEPAAGDGQAFTGVLPIYPLAGRLNQKLLRRLIRTTINSYAAHIETDIPPAIRNAREVMDSAEALAAVHLPPGAGAAQAALRSLAYDELFHFQLAVARRALARKSAVRPARAYPRALQTRLIESLPFRLTEDQARVVAELRADAESASPQSRLLQGDVGSGKTLTAFLACLPYIEAGRQTALMAPTELLARQHADNAARCLEPLGVRLAFFSGSIPARARAPLTEALKAGQVDLVLGTHALFSSDVAFRDLGFVIIDELHRFGVAQRERLSAKGLRPDVLVMSATPIPRTLALSAFGDMEVSTIRSMPPGRLGVETHLAVHGREGKVYEWVRREIQAGRQAYFVYPVIHENGDSGLRDAEGMYRRLGSDVFPGVPMGLIHSRLDEERKRSVMAEFCRGDLRILVATSVVEVGVDVPNATCMVIEQAERFGLAALHQLRGRVGRGAHRSYAFLVYDPRLSDAAKRRLLILKESQDGFRIAEEDLSLRGPGEMTGIRQSGALDFHFARLPDDLELMIQARDDAFALLAADPGLIDPTHRALARRMEKLSCA